MLINDPFPVPLLDLKSSVVGFEVVDQQTPLELISAPPSSVISPPEMAADAVMDVTVTVVSTGTTTGFEVKEISSP